MPDRFSISVFLLACSFVPCSPGYGQNPPAVQDTIIPQTALSTCAALSVTQRQDVAPGTSLAVSADGRRFVRYFHTVRGAELEILDRETAEVRRVLLEPPQLPPGVTWRITDVVFSPTGDLLAVQSVGTVWVLSTERGEVLYRIPADKEKQLYPGQVSLAGGRLLLAFWPPESLLATAEPKNPVEVRLYDAASGQWRQTLFLRLKTPDAWTRLALSPNGEQLAVLQRATRWPSKARLAVYHTSDAVPLWQKKVGAEDLAWTADPREMLLLGNELFWIDTANGKKLRAAEPKIRFSEYQKLRTSEPNGIAAGYFLRYNPFKRSLAMGDARAPQFLLWRLNARKPLCQIQISESLHVDAWLTSRGEIMALEETYDVRPELRILRAARIVSYKISD